MQTDKDKNWKVHVRNPKYNISFETSCKMSIFIYANSSTTAQATTKDLILVIGNTLI